MGFDASTGPKELSVRMAATLENIDRVSDHVRRFLDVGGLTACRFAVLLLLREALLNAVKHGSGLDPDKEVRFSLHLNAGALVITVRDDGPGFDWREVMSRGVSDLSDSGRGLCIMRMYADEVRYSDGGRTLTLVKIACKADQANQGPVS